MRRTGNRSTVPEMGMNVCATTKGVRAGVCADAERADTAALPATSIAADFNISRRGLRFMLPPQRTVGSLALRTVIGDERFKRCIKPFVGDLVARRQLARRDAGKRRAG